MHFFVVWRHLYSKAPLKVVARNATVASIISGAANKHGMTPEQAVELAVAASVASKNAEG